MENESEEINTSKRKNKINKAKIKKNDKNYIIKIIDLNDKDEDSSIVTTKKIGSYYFFKI